MKVTPQEPQEEVAKIGGRGGIPPGIFRGKREKKKTAEKICLPDGRSPNMGTGDWGGSCKKTKPGGEIMRPHEKGRYFTLWT